MVSRGAAPHERLIFRLALLAGLPGVVISMILLWRGGYSAKVQWTLGLVIVGGWVVTALVLRERVVRPLQTLSNMLAALREGDYSIRARGADREDALGLAFLESNLLGETLRTQRLGAMEATALLRTVMSEIDVAVFAFDDADRLRLVNRAGERLLARPAERLLGRTAEQVGLSDELEGASPRRIDVAFPGGAGRWEVRRGSFRQDGRPHTLVVLADLSKTLREEELQAWQRIVRVLSHEINNSLAPIKSIAGSLTSLVDRQPRPPDSDDDLRRGLGVIAGRSEALVRFMSAYARLARLPAPSKAPLDVATWVRRVVALETRLPVTISGGPRTLLDADGDQLDQLLINLIRNAVDAALETHGGVRVRWLDDRDMLALHVEDDGPGIANSSNLFVPFFTTKPQGSGIGLVLCRQIAEAHGGSLSLENRAHGSEAHGSEAHGSEAQVSGSIATLRLPLPMQAD
ncbi:MAG TPA: ATP-binding protein [Gemmatimonadaceae bacterium]|jgi:nitrogen fixation/metabolism regulation signal transduction histidine kinase|nr:ATP-binding protein [Gemmatimonadaceae bacterium]